jgi:pimeloyl-ACP methyl ester carboxylesterase
MADDVEALRLHLGVDAPVLLGASFGGMVALQYAVRHPDSLSKLILADTAPSNDYYATSIERAGRYDWVTPPSQAEEIVKGIPHADLHIFENSGHNPLVEETREFLGTVTRFIRA